MLALLVGLSIALLTAYFGESASGGLHAVQRGFLRGLAPLQEGASRALKPARDFVGWAGDVFDAKSENKKLRRQVQGLQDQLAASQTAARDAQRAPGAGRLQPLGRLPDGLPAGGGARDRALADGLVLDDHDRQGLRSGRARRTSRSMSGSGLVGKVSDVAADAARVTLLTDHTSGVSGQVVPNGANGLVKATVGNPSDLILDFVQKGRPVPKGATVITLGLALLAPRVALPARNPDREAVTRSDSNERELYQRVHLRPFADLRDLDVVEILTRGGSSAGQKAQLGPVNVSPARSSGSRCWCSSTVVLQLAVVTQITVLDADADLFPLVTLSVGLLAGPIPGRDLRLPARAGRRHGAAPDARRDLAAADRRRLPRGPLPRAAGRLAQARAGRSGAADRDARLRDALLARPVPARRGVAPSAHS